MHPIITLDNITAGYDGRAQVRNATVSVDKCGYLGIIGPNGGGKTTLVRVILGLLRPMSGTVRYFRDGLETPHLKIGYLPQHNSIDRDFPISVYETVLSGLNGEKRLFGKFTRKHHDMAAETMRMMALDGMGDRPIKALSGGELQRVLTARAIVAHPEALVLDEPDTYIDPQFKEQMHNMLATINRNCAIIMVSHDTDYIKTNAKTVAWVNETLTIMPR